MAVRAPASNLKGAVATTGYELERRGQRMTRVLHIAATAFLLGAQTFAAPPVRRLTTNQLERISAETEAAANAHDAETVLSYLATNAVITVEFPNNPGIQGMRFSKQTYERHLLEGWAQMRTFSVRRLRTQHEISADGQSAIVTTVLRQTGTPKATGRIFSALATEVATVKLLNGKPRAVNIDVTVTFHQPAGGAPERPAEGHSGTLQP